MQVATDRMPAAQAGTVTMGGDLTVNRMGFGAMRIVGKGSGALPQTATALWPRCAARLSWRQFYRHRRFLRPEVSEELIAEALYPYPAGLVIASKAGWVRGGPFIWQHNASPGHIQEALEGSLKRLRLERIRYLPVACARSGDVVRCVDGSFCAAQGAG